MTSGFFSSVTCTREGNRRLSERGALPPKTHGLHQPNVKRKLRTFFILFVFFYFRDVFSKWSFFFVFKNYSCFVLVLLDDIAAHLRFM